MGSAFAPSRNTAKSPYQSGADLAKWGWTVWPYENIDDSFKDLYRTWGIGWALDALGLDTYTTDFGGLNALFVIDHENHHPNAMYVDFQKYQVDGKWYRATGASYSFTLNVAEGAIIALNRKSPKYAAGERSPTVPLDGLPGLNQFSDVAWIGRWSYVRICRNNCTHQCRMANACTSAKSARE